MTYVNYYYTSVQKKNIKYCEYKIYKFLLNVRQNGCQ